MTALQDSHYGSSSIAAAVSIFLLIPRFQWKMVAAKCQRKSNCSFHKTSFSIRFAIISWVVVFVSTSVVMTLLLLITARLSFQAFVHLLIFSANMGGYFDSSRRTSNSILLLLLRVQAMLSEAQEEGREEGTERSRGSQERSATRKRIQRKGTPLAVFRWPVHLPCFLLLVFSVASCCWFASW